MPDDHYRLEVAQPILTNTDLEKVRAISSLVGDAFRTRTIDVTWPAGEGAAGMAPAVDRICREATDAVLDGYNILILSDRAVSPTRIPMPALLATAAVHHHLIRRGLRTSTGSGGGDRRGARGAPFLRAGRLRRGGDQPVSGVRDAGADPRCRTG